MPKWPVRRNGRVLPLDRAVSSPRGSKRGSVAVILAGLVEELAHQVGRVAAVATGRAHRRGRPFVAQSVTAAPTPGTAGPPPGSVATDRRALRVRRRARTARGPGAPARLRTTTRSVLCSGVTSVVFRPRRPGKPPPIPPPPRPGPAAPPPPPLLCLLRPLRRPGRRRRHHRRRVRPRRRLRGLRTGLVERDDFASGTSSKSSKLVHGGLRYLQQGEVRLVYEALHERQRLTRNAPHLVKVLPFLIPMFTARTGAQPQAGPRPSARPCGCTTSPAAPASASCTSASRRRGDGAHADAAPDRSPASYLYYDAQADDARLTLALARTAAIDHGAVVANGARGRGRHRAPTGAVGRATVEADGERSTCGLVIVNATGVWADDVRALDEGPPRLDPAGQGHPHHGAVGPRAQRHRRRGPGAQGPASVFVVPWGDHTYIGTTDTDYDGPLDDPSAPPRTSSTCSGDQLLHRRHHHARRRRRHVGRAAAAGEVGGSEPHRRPVPPAPVAVVASGVVTVTGGKLTTYREMAADTVDAVVDASATARLDRLQPHQAPAAAPGRGLRHGRGHRRRRAAPSTSPTATAARPAWCSP